MSQTVLLMREIAYQNLKRAQSSKEMANLEI